MKLSSFLLGGGLALAAFASWIPTGQAKFLRSETFPRVYTATVPKPDPSTDDSSAIHFAAEVDLIKAAEADIPGFMKISFLVHSERELEYLTRLADRTMGMEPDSQATQALRDEANYNDDNEGRQVSPSYSTIQGFSCYRDLAGTEQFMSDLVDQAQSIPNLEVTLTDIGDSYVKTQNQNDGYDMWALKITGNDVAAQGRTTEKGILFAMTGIHAREYAPPELVARWAFMLVNGYAEGDADIVSILDHTEIHLVLQSNPDGRRVAETDREQWRRKNLNPSGGDATICGEDLYGVDLNRNFPFKWGLNSGSSGEPCSEIYRGSSPASEPEVQAIVNYVSSIFPEDQRKPDPEGQMNEPYSETAKGVFFDIHSFGEDIIWPWGHVNEETGNDLGLETLATKYRHSNGYELAGPGDGFYGEASGATDDWAYGTLGAAGMTFELGTAFYQDCSYFESDIVPKNLPALMYAAKVSKAPYSIAKGPDVTSLSLSSTSVPTDGQLTVQVSVSDNSWSSSSVSTSQQTLQEIRFFVDEHPYDLDANGNAPTGTDISGGDQNSGTATLTFSLAQLPSLAVGRHVVYVQATDSAGYTGPVTAASFDVTDPGSTNNPACSDTTNTFQVPQISQGHDCAWLALNEDRFGYLCEYFDVAMACPSTCLYCDRSLNVTEPDSKILPGCSDTTNNFQVPQISQEHDDCAWLALNEDRFVFLCQYFDVAVACPSTCQYCDIFG